MAKLDRAFDRLTTTYISEEWVHCSECHTPVDFDDAVEVFHISWSLIPFYFCDLDCSTLWLSKRDREEIKQ